MRDLAEFLEAKKCDVLSVIVNRVAPDDVTEAAARLREGAPDAFPVFILPAHPLLDKPTVGEIKTALGAEMLHGDAQRLDREVLHYKVAAMELPHFLDHLEEGSLVITPGDRSDIMIGTLVADAATSYPGVAGVILTGGFKPVPQVRRLFEGLKRSSVPILYVEDRHLCDGDDGKLPACRDRPREPEEDRRRPWGFRVPYRPEPAGAAHRRHALFPRHAAHVPT